MQPHRAQSGQGSGCENIRAAAVFGNRFSSSRTEERTPHTRAIATPMKKARSKEAGAKEPGFTPCCFLFFPVLSIPASQNICEASVRLRLMRRRTRLLPGQGSRGETRLRRVRLFEARRGPVRLRLMRRRTYLILSFHMSCVEGSGLSSGTRSRRTKGQPE